MTEYLHLRETHFESIKILFVGRDDDRFEGFKYLRSIKCSSPSDFGWITEVLKIGSHEKVWSIDVLKCDMVVRNIEPFTDIWIPDSIRSDHSKYPIAIWSDITDIEFIGESCWSPPSGEELGSCPCLEYFWFRKGEYTRCGEHRVYGYKIIFPHITIHCIYDIRLMASMDLWLLSVQIFSQSRGSHWVQDYRYLDNNIYFLLILHRAESNHTLVRNLYMSQVLS